MAGFSLTIFWRRINTYPYISRYNIIENEKHMLGPIHKYTQDLGPDRKDRRTYTGGFFTS